MQALLDVIAPVFLVIGAGYVAVWSGYISDEIVDAMLKFAQGFAFPVMLGWAMWTLDLGQSFDPRLLVSYYSGSLIGFASGFFGARYLFGRDWEDAVTIGFTCLFANSLMLGMAITERAYGPDSLGPNFAIVALHSPIAYGIGITIMEILRARGKDPRQVPGTVLRAMFSNALIVGITVGMIFNLVGLPQPAPIADALQMIIQTALPMALFAMGGVLYRYRPEGDIRIIAFVCAVSLVLHPTITFTLGTAFGLGDGAMRSAVLTAAMAPGINAYVFANMYGRARRVAASSVLVATALSILTAWVWLGAVP